MRNAIITALILVLLGTSATYFYFSPYLALAEIRKAAKANDTDKLAERVDFPKLREGVKGQANALIAQKLNRQMGNNPFAAFGAAMATDVVDAMVDAYVSPAAIGALVAGLSPRHSKPNARYQPEPAPPADVLPEADTGRASAALDQPKTEKTSVQFDSLQQASVYVIGKRGEKVRFVLHLDGLRWRLINIVFPAGTVRWRLSSPATPTTAVGSSRSC